jgi:hypothetical protein
MHAKKDTDDVLLDMLAAAASRAIDHKVTGVVDGDNYFLLETITNERLRGQIDSNGEMIFVYPHKPRITSISAFTYQQNITKQAYTVDPTRIDILDRKSVV